MRIIGYVRVSTEEQAMGGQSLDSQAAKLKAYAALYDLELVEVIVDAGVSAKNLKRPGLQRALSMLQTGQAEGLVICKLDRLTRSIADWQKLIELHFSEKAGKQLFSVGDSIDTRTAAGRLVLNVLMSVAQWEREKIGESTRENLQYKIAQGERCGRVRYGFDLAADGVHLVPNSQEQDAIRLMRELRATGKSYPAIAAELTTRGIKTKQSEKPWLPMTVRNILLRAA